MDPKGAKIETAPEAFLKRSRTVGETAMTAIASYAGNHEVTAEPVAQQALAVAPDVGEHPQVGEYAHVGSPMAPRAAFPPAAPAVFGAYPMHGQP